MIEVRVTITPEERSGVVHPFVRGARVLSEWCCPTLANAGL